MTNAPDAADPSPPPADHSAGTRAETTIAVDREVVFAHLLEPRTYPDNLVGAKDIRAVDRHWPEPGAQFHHRVGVGPLTIDDATTVVAVSEPDELILRASVGPLGTALVRFRLLGSNPTLVKFDEAPDSGLLSVVGTTFGRFILKVSVWGRNETSLQRLKDLIEPNQHRTGRTQALINQELDPPA